MKDFTFSFRGDDMFPLERVRIIEDVVRKQAEAILSSEKLQTKDVFISQKEMERNNAVKKFRWVNDDVKIDFPVPNTIKNTMEEAEQLDLDNNSAEYPYVSDMLDVMGKEAYVNGLLTKEQWDKICERYPYLM